MYARFRPLDDHHCEKLKIFIHEAEDLFLMKAQRAGSKDLEDLENLAKKVKLDAQLILERFKKEILPLNACDDELLKDRFLSCIDKVFGEKVASGFTKQIKYRTN